MTQPRLLGGRYELDGVIGRGGMAEVYRARDLRLDRIVAVKTLRSDLARDPTFQARFSREAQSAASLNHPSVIAVYDTGEDMLGDMSIPYIVMEYAEGQTLRDLLRENLRLRPERAMEIVDGILRALDYSHRGGIVHRDIKPANVMLTRNHEVKVMDFGIARAVADTSATMTQTSAVIGTVQYLSPEQARGEKVDARSDIYSTGCLLYELLTGRQPFVGDSPVSVAYQHVREEPVPPSSLDADVPAAADAIVLRALTKDREQRYQTADEMRADIRRALDGRPVAAPVPAATTERMGAPVAMAGTTTLPAVSEGEEPDRRDRGGRALAYALLGLAVVAVFVIAALVGKALFDQGGGAGKVTVPDVQGLTLAQAQAKIRGLGLTVGTVTQKASETVDKGTFMDQSPEPNTELASGRPVSLTVSTGVDEVAVPELVGLSLDEASAELRRAGLQLGERKYVDSTESRNVVTKVNPAEGTTVPANSKVNLEVASGNNKVPDVVGKPRDEARRLLEDAGFSVQSSEREDGSKPPGTVLQQSPQGGGTARLDTTVTLVVAKAP